MGPLETLLVVLVTSVVGYFFGKRQTEQQRIIEERAKVLSDLFKRYVDLEEQVYLLVQILDLSGEPDRKEKYRRAAESFNNLLAYHRRNSIWLSRPTARYVDRFIESYREYFKPFGPFREEEEVGRPDTAEEWLNAWQRFQKESPKLRDTLEEEFRRALGHGATWAKLGGWRWVFQVHALQQHRGVAAERRHRTFSSAGVSADDVTPSEATGAADEPVLPA